MIGAASSVFTVCVLPASRFPRAAVIGGRTDATSLPPIQNQVESISIPSPPMMYRTICATWSDGYVALVWSRVIIFPSFIILSMPRGALKKSSQHLPANPEPRGSSTPKPPSEIPKPMLRRDDGVMTSVVHNEYEDGNQYREASAA